AVTLAWAQTHELSAASIDAAARVGAWELYRARLPLGMPVAVTGTLAWSDPATIRGPWRRALLTLDEGLPCQLFLPAAIEPAADRLRVCGTFLGTEDDAGGVTVLAVAALAPAGASTPAVINVDATGPAIAEDPLLRAVDDYRTALERPAYEALLTAVAKDPLSPTPSIHDIAGRLWKDAAPYRGQRFHATGRVIRAWEDPLVAIDQPAGIGRVLRVLMHHYDTGLIGAFIRDSEKDGDTGLRIYELAVLGDQPAPRPGDEIVADGRFLKLNRRPLTGGEVRASDHAWSVMLVTKGYRVLPQRGEGPVPLFSWVLLGLGGAVLGFIVYRLVIQLRRDRELLRELREAADKRAAITGGRPVKPSDSTPVSD
nr:hypothetical protein [Planctomycetota bacterium]